MITAKDYSDLMHWMSGKKSRYFDVKNEANKSVAWVYDYDLRVGQHIHDGSEIAGIDLEGKAMKEAAAEMERLRKVVDSSHANVGVQRHAKAMGR